MRKRWAVALAAVAALAALGCNGEKGDSWPPPDSDNGGDEILLPDIDDIKVSVNVVGRREETKNGRTRHHVWYHVNVAGLPKRSDRYAEGDCRNIPDYKVTGYVLELTEQGRFVTGVSDPCGGGSSGTLNGYTKTKGAQPSAAALTVELFGRGN